MTSSVCQCVELNAPELFAAPDFAAWVNRRAGQGLATWHWPSDRGTDAMGEYSDVFLVYDLGGSGDATGHADEAMPEWAWETVCREVEGLGVRYAVVRLTNFPA